MQVGLGAGAAGSACYRARWSETEGQPPGPISSPLPLQLRLALRVSPDRYVRYTSASRRRASREETSFCDVAAVHAAPVTQAGAAGAIR